MKSIRLTTHSRRLSMIYVPVRGEALINELSTRRLQVHFEKVFHLKLFVSRKVPSAIFVWELFLPRMMSEREIIFSPYHLSLKVLNGFEIKEFLKKLTGSSLEAPNSWTTYSHRIADLDLFTSLNEQPIAFLTLCHSNFIKYIEKKAATAKRDSRSGQNVFIAVVNYVHCNLTRTKYTMRLERRRRRKMNRITKVAAAKWTKSIEPNNMKIIKRKKLTTVFGLDRYHYQAWPRTCS